MIPRYVLPEMAAVWSDDARLQHRLEIEILVAEALAELGVVPDADAREIRALASFDAERVAEVEGASPGTSPRSCRSSPRPSGPRAVGCTSG